MLRVTSWFTLLTCLFIHTQVMLGNWWFAYATYEEWPLFWSIPPGILYLLYPLCGWLAEIYSKSFKIIQWSFYMFLLSSVALFALALTEILTALLIHPDPETKYFPALISALTAVIAIIASLIGLGLYEANAIQFGMDQMLDASSEQLSSFIHWYFWCAHVGPAAIYYITVSVYFYSSRYTDIIEDKFYGYILYYLSWIILLTSLIQLILAVVVIILTICYKKKHYIEQISRNPLSIVIKVLKYSYEHKCPENRSAFTYWENEVPSRIDFGKQKYGGPFTNEEVEDVKTMFRLILLMVSLFGFYLSGDGYSFSSYIMKTMGCPTFAPFVLFIMNPQHIPSLIVLIGVPCYQLVIKKYQFISYFTLLKRIWVGLLLCLVYEALQCCYSIPMQEEKFKCPLFINKKVTTHRLQCLVANVKVVRNMTHEYYCSSPVNSLTINLSFIIPIVYGVSYILVFLSVLEFICAQSPNAMKGLMIGVWYFMMSIKYLFINILDTRQNLLDTDTWNIYHGAKGVGIFISIIAFSSVCQKYKYRERDEIVNEQAIIEELYERELLINSKEID